MALARIVTPRLDVDFETNRNPSGTNNTREIGFERHAMAVPPITRVALGRPRDVSTDTITTAAASSAQRMLP
jgi:hypothetical protein